MPDCGALGDIIDGQETRLEKLEIFFKEVVTLTLRHKVIDDYAVVYPNDLDVALSKVDPEWWKQHA